MKEAFVYLLLWVWQLPQNVAGLLVVAVTRARCAGGIFLTRRCDSLLSAVSLGSFIIFGRSLATEKAVRHEQGHQRQSVRLGWLYLAVIGLPSLCGNVFDRVAHRSWTREARIRWYYAQPWEAWADRLGGVERNTAKSANI